MNRTSPTRTTSKTCREPPRGFTLIEVMVVVAILGLLMSTVVFRHEALLPQTRLRASARELAGAVKQMRTFAVLNHKSLEFAYDLDRSGFEAYFPYLMDDDGLELGPGKTSVHDFQRTHQNIRIREVRLPDSTPREAGLVTLPISSMGRIAPHDVVLHNPDHPETEVLTVRFVGLGLDFQIFEGTSDVEEVTDASFR